MFEASKLLNLGASTFATACTMFHRFYHPQSLKEYDVWSVAIASTLQAIKVEEPHTLKTIIHIFCHLYRKPLLIANKEKNASKELFFQHASIVSSEMAQTWSLEQKEQTLTKTPLPM
jgi:hypothetical protein